MVDIFKEKALSDHMYSVYFSWSKHFVKSDPDKGEAFLNKCLDVNPFDLEALYLRSICKRGVAAENALEDALLARSIQPLSSNINLEVCNCLYELNQFENCKIELHDNVRKYLSKMVKAFKDSLIVFDGNLQDSLGDSLDFFLSNHKKVLPSIAEAIKRKGMKETRPLWKIRRELEECDVLSVEEEREEFVSPLELARRGRWFRIFNQIYFGRNWVDKVFLRGLIVNDKWMAPIFTNSTPYLQKILKPEYQTVNRFLRMLHARSPLYNEYYQRFGNRKFLKKNREQYLYQKQFQTRRMLFTVLREIKNLRKLGKIEEMSNYIEKFMGDFVVLKTSRIMPWKFEFVNEVYNILALAHADRYVIPTNLTRKFDPFQRLAKILNIPDAGKVTPTEFVFGDRSTYVSMEVANPLFEKQKKLTSRLERRMVFAKYSIEKCYLMHETARFYFKQNRFDECYSWAKRAIEEAKSCNSLLWTLHCMMITVKTFAVQHKVEYCQHALTDALQVALHLNNPDIVAYLQHAITINDIGISVRKSNFAEIRQRDSKSRESVGSQFSTKTDSIPSNNRISNMSFISQSNRTDTIA